MNRIEAINAMLDGEVIKPYGCWRMRIHEGWLQSYNDRTLCWESMTKESFCLSRDDRYEIYEEPKPEDTIRITINGKKYRLVETSDKMVEE